eukprot:TRINITY_DN3762_c0_g1_i1.p1 TRINITY_DN3762_c0_g1~~TRINITY_DN3762_c0_g1_i1.p1  ORF type:complete len:472 (-),score=71.70 TRINITY_DN3762_c0_g1_i1:329-1744(-)
MESGLSLVCKTTTTFQNGESLSRTIEGFAAFPANSQPPHFLLHSPSNKGYIKSEKPIVSFKNEEVFSQNPISLQPPLITHNADHLQFSSPIQCKVTLGANGNQAEYIYPPKPNVNTKLLFPLVADPDENSDTITIRDDVEFDLSLKTKPLIDDVNILCCKLTLFEECEKVDNSDGVHISNKVSINSGTQIPSHEKIVLGELDLIHQTQSHSHLFEDSGAGLFESRSNHFAIPGLKFRFVAANRGSAVDGIETNVKLEWSENRKSWICYFSLTNYSSYSLWVKKLCYSISTPDVKVKLVEKILNPFDIVPSSVTFAVDTGESDPKETPKVEVKWVHEIIPRGIQYYHFGVHNFSLPCIDTIAIQTVIRSPFIKDNFIELSGTMAVDIEFRNRGSTGVVISSIYAFFESSFLRVLPNTNSSIKVVSRDFEEVTTLLPSKMELFSGETKSISFSFLCFLCLFKFILSLFIFYFC